MRTRRHACSAGRTAAPPPARSRRRGPARSSSTSSRTCRRPCSGCWAVWSSPGSSPASAGARREPLSFRARVLTSAQPGIEQRAGTDGLRRDLLAHLNVLIMRVPPLREYAEDVPDLLRHQVDRLVDGEGLPFRRFSVAAQNRLRNYTWPDNVRELRHLVHRLLIHG